MTNAWQGAAFVAESDQCSLHEVAEPWEEIVKFSQIPSSVPPFPTPKKNKRFRYRIVIKLYGCGPEFWKFFSMVTFMSLLGPQVKTVRFLKFRELLGSEVLVFGLLCLSLLWVSVLGSLVHNCFWSFCYWFLSFIQLLDAHFWCLAFKGTGASFIDAFVEALCNLCNLPRKQTAATFRHPKEKKHNTHNIYNKPSTKHLESTTNHQFAGSKNVRSFFWGVLGATLLSSVYLVEA